MDAPRYHPVSIALHWIIVLLVLAQLVLGWSMIEIPKSPPGVRASYAADYYGAYVRDLDGNKLHFVRRGED